MTGDVLMSNISKLKLIGDGTSFGTRLIDTATGENLLERYAIAAIRVETSGGTHVGPKVTLELHPACLEVEIRSALDEVVLDIFYPGLTQAFHADNPSIEEASSAEKPKQS